ncbi:hypothetical protein NUW58_g523 [Xylaria curta]|nr:hypothetical protein NUW58_g523 [Xylaria curta]
MLSHDCVRVYRPLSLVRRYPQFFKPELSNADFETRMKMELQTMQDVSQKVTRTVIDTTQRRASISSELTIITGDDQPRKTVEVIWDLDFTEDGTRISRIFEFVDTYEATAVIEEMLSKAVSSSQ